MKNGLRIRTQRPRKPPCPKKNGVKLIKTVKIRVFRCCAVNTKRLGKNGCTKTRAYEPFFWSKVGKKLRKKLKSQISRKRCVLEQNGRADAPPTTIHPRLLSPSPPSGLVKIGLKLKVSESSNCPAKAQYVKIFDIGQFYTFSTA